ncbi:MAG: response regulator [bacterium]
MSKSVLIVDDEMSNVKYLSALLHEHGYTSCFACDGNEGFDRIKEKKPDLIILDILMPRLSGFGLFKILKEDDDLKKIPVIMLTAVSHVTGVDMKRKGKLKSIIGTEPDIYIEKPVEPEELIGAVKQLIGEP